MLFRSRQLTVVDSSCFSAGTVLTGTGRLIIFNPVHGNGRLANSIAHELAHLLLEHAPGPDIGPGGCRVWDHEMESQADLLAAVLLVSRDAALACARIGLPHPVGAARFGVSADLMRWRTDYTGAARQAYAAAQRRGRTIPHLGVAEVRTLVDSCSLSYRSSTRSGGLPSSPHAEARWPKAPCQTSSTLSNRLADRHSDSCTGPTTSGIRCGRVLTAVVPQFAIGLAHSHILDTFAGAERESTESWRDLVRDLRRRGRTGAGRR